MKYSFSKNARRVNRLAILLRLETSPFPPSTVLDGGITAGTKVDESLISSTDHSNDDRNVDTSLQANGLDETYSLSSSIIIQVSSHSINISENFSPVCRTCPSHFPRPRKHLSWMIGKPSDAENQGLEKSLSLWVFLRAFKDEC